MASPLITTRSLGQIVQSWTAAAQAACSTALNFAVGTVNLALAQGGGSLGLWLQQVALYILGLTRFATSLGVDADSWGADWGYKRLPGVAATGNLTFSRTDTTVQAVVPVGATVQTADGSQTFTVTLDLTNIAYNAGLGGYVIAAGTASVTVPAQCAAVGVAGNVLASTISVITSSIAAVTTVNNAAAFVNGAAAETDAAYKARFVLFLAGLATSNEAAINSAIANVQQGLKYVKVENYDYPGVTIDNGNFFVIIDDGSHAPPASLVTAVYNAIYPIRGFTVRFSVNAPTPVTVNVAGTVTSAAGFVHGAVVQAVDTAWANYLNNLPLGTLAITISGLIATAMAVPGVTNVDRTTVLINSVNADLTLTVVQAAVPGTISAA